jgi:hypothetical protein
LKLTPEMVALQELIKRQQTEIGAIIKGEN